jgi:hypothetical protein
LGHYFEFRPPRDRAKRKKFRAELRRHCVRRKGTDRVCGVCQTARPDACIVEDDDGRPVPLCQSCFRERMQLLKDLVWEAHVGPIPDGKKVSQADGDITNNRLENLCLVDEADYPGDDGQVYVLLA